MDRHEQTPTGHPLGHRPQRWHPERLGAEARPTGTPDGDKLERAILDALKWGGAYEDDAQVTDMHWRKRYATPGSPDPWILDRPGAVIVVRGAS